MSVISKERRPREKRSKAKLCKTIHQYSRGRVPAADMERLLEIAEDCRRVRAYVYARYSGIGSLAKLYPGYTIQNEMTECGLRDRLGLPSVYFYLAMFDALGDIKCQWSRTKAKLLELVGKNEGLSPEEKHYLRFILRVSNAFEAVLRQEPVELPAQMQAAYEELASQVDGEKLRRYLCRQVRRYHRKPGSDKEQARGFSLSAKAYRYADQGIYVATKEKRKRIFIPLTDRNRYDRQIYIKLYPESGEVQIDVPVDVAVKHHKDQGEPIGVALGMHTMLTTDQGRRYGVELGRYQTEHAEWIREQARSYSRNRQANPGRKKYEAKKKRSTERLHSYINQELNIFLQTEKPKAIYMAKLPGTQPACQPRSESAGKNKRIDHAMSMWQRGYIRKRLEQKCREHSVEIIQVFGKDISNTCSVCGAIGMKRTVGDTAKEMPERAAREMVQGMAQDMATRMFFCPVCGVELEEKTNTARNAKKRGQGMVREMGPL